MRCWCSLNYHVSYLFSFSIFHPSNPHPSHFVVFGVLIALSHSLTNKSTKTKPEKRQWTHLHVINGYLIRSIVHSIIRSIVHSIIPAFIHSFFHSFVRSFFHLILIYSVIQSFKTNNNIVMVFTHVLVNIPIYTINTIPGQRAHTPSEGERALRVIDSFSASKKKLKRHLLKCLPQVVNVNV